MATRSAMAWRKFRSSYGEAARDGVVVDVDDTENLAPHLDGDADDGAQLEVEDALEVSEALVEAIAAHPREPALADLAVRCGGELITARAERAARAARFEGGEEGVP
jgi:hypothetical protein